MARILQTLKKLSGNAYCFLFALLPGAALTTFYAGLTRKDISIIYTDDSAAIKIGIAVGIAILTGLIVLIIKREPFIAVLKNPQSLLIGVLVGLCLPNNLEWWQISASVAFAIIVGRLLNNRLHPVLLGYVFSLVAFPTTHGLSALMKSEVYNGLLYQVNFVVLLGGLFLVITRQINWRFPLSLFVIYAVLANLFKMKITGMAFSTLIVNSALTPTTCLAIFFIAPFIVSNNIKLIHCIAVSLIISIAVILLNQYAHYPDALLLTLLVINVLQWAISSKNIPLNITQVANTSAHVLLIPLLSAGIVMVAVSSVLQATVIGFVVVLIYLSVQSIKDVGKRYIPPHHTLPLTIVLTAFLSTYISVMIRVTLPALPAVEHFIPLVALSSLILNFSGIFMGEQVPFNMKSALKISALFMIVILLLGSINQLTQLNRVFTAGLFFLLALIALINNPCLSTIETPVSKPNRRVRTTGTIK